MQDYSTVSKKIFSLRKSERKCTALKFNFKLGCFWSIKNPGYLTKCFQPDYHGNASVFYCYVWRWVYPCHYESANRLRNKPLVLRPVTRGSRGSKTPLEKFSLPLEMCWTYFEAIGHSLKNFYPSQKTLCSPWCPQLVTGLLILTHCFSSCC